MWQFAARAIPRRTVVDPHRVWAGVGSLLVGAFACSGEDSSSVVPGGAGGTGAVGGSSGLDASGATGGSGGSAATGGADAATGGSAGTTGGSTGDGGSAGSIGGTGGRADSSSGTRLIRKRVETSYGVGQGIGWHDSLRQERCRYTDTTDGKTRCVPDVQSLSTNTYYSDAACTQPYEAASRLGPCPRKYVFLSQPNCGGFEVHPVGAPVAPAQFYLGPSPCNLSTNGGPQTFVPVLPMIANSEFVAGAPVTDAGEGRLRARYRLGDDGSREFLGWFDATRGDNCAFGLGTDDKMHCLPVSPALSTVVADELMVYSDAACQNGVISPVPCAEPGAKYAGRISDFCDQSTAIHPLGGPAQATHGRSEASCIASARPSSGTSIGAEVPPGEFAEATISLEASAHRVQRRVLVSPDGASQQQGLFDAELQSNCSFQVGEDNSYHCLPTGTENANGYADADCTQPVHVESSSRCNPTISRFAILRNQAVCPTRISVYEVGAPVTLPSIYIRNASGACVDDGPPDNPVRGLTRLGPERFESGIEVN